MYGRNTVHCVCSFWRGKKRLWSLSVISKRNPWNRRARNRRAWNKRAWNKRAGLNQYKGRSAWNSYRKTFLIKNLNLSPNCFLWLCVKAKAKEVYIETRNNERIVTKSMNKINNAVQTYWKLVFDNNSHSPTSFPTLDTKLVNCNFNREIHVWNYGVYYFWGYSSLSLSLICILFISLNLNSSDLWQIRLCLGKHCK